MQSKDRRSAGPDREDQESVESRGVRDFDAGPDPRLAMRAPAGTMDPAAERAGWATALITRLRPLSEPLASSGRP